MPFNKLPGLFGKYGRTASSKTNAGLQLMANRAKYIVTTETANAPPASANGGIGAVDTGKYLRSWKVTKTTLNGIRGVLITNSASYMAVIERGRGAGKRPPPVDVIARWAMRRLGLPYKEARRAAWPIAKAIGRRGLYARRVMTGNNAKNSYRENMREIMGGAIDAASVQVFS